MLTIYKDIGQICQLIEEKMKNMGFEALGNKGIIWETSTSMNYPEDWLYARAYLKKRQPKKVIGYCIHLGGYDEEDKEILKQLGLTLPFINVSVLKLQSKATDFNRNEIYNSLYNAGWVSEQPKIIDNKVVYSKVNDEYVAEAYTATYFLNLLALNSEDVINKLIVQPINEMYSGKDEWVIQSNLPVLKIGIVVGKMKC